MSMENTALPQLTQGELEVMDILWSMNHDLTRTEILPLVEEKFHRNWKIQTLSTYLAHLVEKGVLKYYRKGVYFYYQVLIPKKEYKALETKRFLKFWYNNSIDELIMGLTDEKVLSEEDTKIIEGLIDELDN